MIDERIFKIELRQGKERSIKSYVLRSNVLDDKGERVIEDSKDSLIFYEEGSRLNSESLFGSSKPFIIEIGFGMGTATIEIAKSRSDCNFLGLEVYLEGVVKLLKKIREEGVKNLKVMRFNAVDVLSHLIDDDSVDGFHIFFPDPWMKKKHHKRRLMNPAFIDLLVSKLRKGGYIYFVTDWVEYADEVLSLFNENTKLLNPYDGFAPHMQWRPETKFEAKGKEKEHEVRELWVEKK